MTSDKIRKKFLNYFKKNNHKVIKSSSLLPFDDSSVLLTTAGMQQLKPYFLGQKSVEKKFGSKQLISIQRCFRTSDIEEVGDPWHLTFFEMLGNFSIDEYFKEKAINLAWKFLTREIKLKKNKLWATYYNGDKTAPIDIETRELWKNYLPAERIIGFPKKENWWGPPGSSGPCGPCSELHYDFSEKPCSKGKKCLPNCQCGRFMELWNLVFIQFYMNENGKITSLPIKSIDTGMGLERLALILQKSNSIFNTDLFEELIQLITADKHFGAVNKKEDIIRKRIVADHIKGTYFLLADGVNFSNKEQGYILRRIFRRALDQYKYPNIEINNIQSLINIIRNNYHLSGQLQSKNDENIIRQIKQELDMYKQILNLDIDKMVAKISSLKKQTKYICKAEPSKRKLSSHEAFLLYTTYGLSPERLKRKGFVFDEISFNNEIKKHQQLSRAGAQKKFGGHGINSLEWTDQEKEKMTRLHTATHLLQQALRDVLGNHVKQQGSDINPDRLRFDFEHPKKLTDEEKTQIEKIINQKIIADLPVKREVMEYKRAIAEGALAFFKEKYPEKVTVYSVNNYSKELCNGPHVKSTGKIGKFTILSEKSSASGIRRIKATIS